MPITFFIASILNGDSFFWGFTYMSEVDGDFCLERIDRAWDTLPLQSNISTTRSRIFPPCPVPLSCQTFLEMFTWKDGTLSFLKGEKKAHFVSRFLRWDRVVCFKKVSNRDLFCLFCVHFISPFDVFQLPVTGLFIFTVKLQLSNSAYLI